MTMSRKLKALLLFDWYNMKVLYICTAVMILSSSFMTLSQAIQTGSASVGFNAFIGGFAVVLMSTAFAHDDMKNIGVTRRSMPYTEGEMVLSRYLPLFAVSVLSVFTTVIYACIGGAVHGYGHDFIKQLLFCTAIILDFILIIPDIFYPVIFRYGYQKVQVIYGIVTTVTLLYGFITFMVMMTLGSEDETSQFASSLFSAPLTVSIGNIVFVIIMTFISCKLSIRQLRNAD